MFTSEFDHFEVNISQFEDMCLGPRMQFLSIFEND